MHAAVAAHSASKAANFTSARSENLWGFRRNVRHGDSFVADGEWRDYAIDLLKDRAIFSVFRRSSEMPLYRIEKDPKLARRQGAYSVVATGGMILKRGHDLAQVLRVLEKKKHLRVVDA